MFEIHYDQAAGLFHYRMSGFWTMETVGDFVAALRATVATIDRQPPHFDTLCDARDFPVQSKDVSDALGVVMGMARQVKTGRTAVVVGSMMNKVQAERTLAGPDVRIFLTMDEARAWLATPESKAP